MTIFFWFGDIFLRTIIEEWQGKPFDHWSVSVWPTFMNHWLTRVSFGVFCIPVICTLQDKFWLMTLTRQGQGKPVDHTGRFDPLFTNHSWMTSAVTTHLIINQLFTRKIRFARQNPIKPILKLVHWTSFKIGSNWYNVQVTAALLLQIVPCCIAHWAMLRHKNGGGENTKQWAQN